MTGTAKLKEARKALFPLAMAIRYSEDKRLSEKEKTLALKESERLKKIVFNGEAAFEMFSTYGFPPEMYAEEMENTLKKLLVMKLPKTKDGSPREEPPND